MEDPVSGGARVTTGVSARASVQHSGGWSWEQRWLLVTKYLARLREIYDGAPIESNTDLWALINSLLIDTYHLGETFSEQLSLHEQVRSTVANSLDLQLCRDYANTWKHFKRDGNARVAYVWEDGDSETGGHYVTIAYRLQREPLANHTTVDGRVGSVCVGYMASVHEVQRDSRANWSDTALPRPVDEPGAD